MLYVPLDVNWPDNEKIILAGLDGAGLHAVAMCLAKRLEQDGWVGRHLLHRQGATDELIERLIRLNLLEVDGAKVRPWDWHDRNDSQAVIAAKRASKAEAGARGNHNRWQHPGRFEDCDKCQVIAGSDRTGSQGLSTAIAPDRVATSRVTLEVEPAIAPATGALDTPLTDLQLRALQRAQEASA